MGVTVANQRVSVIVTGQEAVVALAPLTQVLSLIPQTADVITVGVQGPVGIGISEEEFVLDLLRRSDNVDDTPSPGILTVYLGWANDPAALDSEAKWKIKRRIIAVDGDLTEKFADGDTLYDNIWDDHLTLTY